MNTRRLLIYLGLNAAVSAAVTLTVLWLWDQAHTPPPPPSLTPPRVASRPTTAPAASTPSPPASATPTLYVVQSGDTLESIAERFSVSIADLMAANGLTDPNVLSVGQTLVISPAGFTPAPATTAAPPTAPIAPPPTTTQNSNAAPARLAIREVRAPGVLEAETLVIVNLGGAMNLAGWSLRDDAGQVYTFPALTLFEGGAVSVHTAAGEDTVTDLYWGRSAPVWASGETAELDDPNGNMQARFSVP